MSETQEGSAGTVLTIRLVRSFEYRNVKNMVLRNVDLNTTTTEKLLEIVAQGSYLNKDLN